MHTLSLTTAHFWLAGVVSEAEFDAFIKSMNLNQNQPPTSKQLLLVAIASGVPFIGFGCCDNSIMILAGDRLSFNHSYENIIDHKKILGIFIKVAGHTS